MNFKDVMVVITVAPSQPASSSGGRELWQLRPHVCAVKSSNFLRMTWGLSWCHPPRATSFAVGRLWQLRPHVCAVRFSKFLRMTWELSWSHPPRATSFAVGRLWQLRPHVCAFEEMFRVVLPESNLQDIRGGFPPWEIVPKQL